MIQESADRIVHEHARRGPGAMVLKRAVQLLFTLVVMPRLLIYRCHQALGAGMAFSAASESLARLPGMRGVYSRQSFYRRTLSRCGNDSYFGFMSCFSMPEASVGDRVYIGRFCSIGFADIGDEAMLADGVQILSGGREHATHGDNAATMQEQTQVYQRLHIGRGAWIGAGAVIMADVGEHAVVGAQALVRTAVPAGCLAVGVPARIINRTAGDSAE